MVGLGRRDAGAGKAGEVKLWNAITGEAIRTFRGHQGQVTCVAFSPDGKQIVSGANELNWNKPGETVLVRLWEASSGARYVRSAGKMGRSQAWPSAPMASASPGPMAKP